MRERPSSGPPAIDSLRAGEPELQLRTNPNRDEPVRLAAIITIGFESDRRRCRSRTHALRQVPIVFDLRDERCDPEPRRRTE